MPLSQRLHCARLCAALLVALGALPSHAESLGSAASSASSAGSASSGSLSDSVGGSSGGKAQKAQVAPGLYRVLEVATLPDRPGHLQLRLAPADAEVAAPGGALWLRLPRAALDTRGLAAGDSVLVHQRPYGLAFAYADQRQGPFYLALHDAWQRDLASQAL